MNALVKLTEEDQQTSNPIKNIGTMVNWFSLLLVYPKFSETLYIYINFSGN